MSGMGGLFTDSEQQERDARMAAAVTSYGVGTKSYNASGEAKESKRQQAESTERYLAQPRASILLPVVCTCLSYPFAHAPHRHSTLKHPGDWTPWQERYYLDTKYNCFVERRNSHDGGGHALNYWEG